MRIWKALKKSYHDTLRMYGAEYSPPSTEKKSSGNGWNDEQKEKFIIMDEDSSWGQIYKKFRNIYGRDPYSSQELRDWWDSL